MITKRLFKEVVYERKKKRLKEVVVIRKNKVFVIVTVAAVILTAGFASVFAADKVNLPFIGRKN